MQRRHRIILLLLCTFVTLSANAEQPAIKAEELKAGVFTPSRQAPDFLLKGSNGADLQLAPYRGKVVVLGFGYTSCPDVCPVTLAALAQAYRQLGALASQVQIIYLTVDPERDTTKQLKQYLAAFDASFIGGSGTAEQMASVRKLYGITAEKHESGNGYVIAHSSFTYLIDRNGQLRALMPFGHKADDYVHDLTLLVKE